MIELHPHFLEKEGKKEFVVIPYEEFEKIYEELDDYEDLKILREAKASEKEVDGHSVNETRKILGLA